jgi:hypothetical protein
MSKIIIIATFLFAITSVIALEFLPDQATTIKGGYRICYTYRYYYYNNYGRIDTPEVFKISRADYDENGILECVYILCDDGTVNSINKRKYDKFGNETLFESSDSYGNVATKQVYNRDDKGRDIEFIVYNKSLDTTHRRISQFRDNLELSLHFRGKTLNNDTLKTLSIYDNIGNCIEEIIYYHIDSIISKNIYRYNKHNQKIEYSEYLPEYGEIIREQYEYNKFGQLTVKIFYTKRSSVTDLWKKEYYDHNGKIIECIWYTNNEPWQRSISTYDNYGNRAKEIIYLYPNQFWNQSVYEQISDKIIFEYSK